MVKADNPALAVLAAFAVLGTAVRQQVVVVAALSIADVAIEAEFLLGFLIFHVLLGADSQDLISRLEVLLNTKQIINEVTKMKPITKEKEKKANTTDLCTHHCHIVSSHARLLLKVALGAVRAAVQAVLATSGALHGAAAVAACLELATGLAVCAMVLLVRTVHSVAQCVKVPAEDRVGMSGRGQLGLIKSVA